MGTEYHVTELRLTSLHQFASRHHFASPNCASPTCTNLHRVTTLYFIYYQRVK